MGTLGHPFVLGSLGFALGRASPQDTSATDPGTGSDPFTLTGAIEQVVILARPAPLAPAASGGTLSIQILE